MAHVPRVPATRQRFCRFLPVKSRTNDRPGRKRQNRSYAECSEDKGQDPVDLTVVVGVKCTASDKVNAFMVQPTERASLQGFTDDLTDPDMVACTDDAVAHRGILNPMPKRSPSTFVQRSSKSTKSFQS